MPPITRSTSLPASVRDVASDGFIAASVVAVGVTGAGCWSDFQDEAGGVHAPSTWKSKNKAYVPADGTSTREMDRASRLFVERVDVEVGEIAIAQGDEVPGCAEVRLSRDHLAVAAHRDRHLGAFAVERELETGDRVGCLDVQRLDRVSRTGNDEVDPERVPLGAGRLEVSEGSICTGGKVGRSTVQRPPVSRTG